MRCIPPSIAAYALLNLVMGCTGPDQTAARYLPTPGKPWQIQFTGVLDTSVDAEVFDLDLFDTPAEAITDFHRRGIKVICYMSAGTYEAWRPDASNIPLLIRGNALIGWPGEQWLDIRHIEELRTVMANRIHVAVKKGCDAVDLDNVDAYENDTGFPISATDQITYNRMLAEESHKQRISIGLKNDLLQVKDLVNDFDFAVNESCAENEDCALLYPFIAAHKAVFTIEYSGTPAAVCPAANQRGFDTIFKRPDLDSYRVSCR